MEQLTCSAGHADRVLPMKNYTKGLLLPLERKSVEPMAARLAPHNVRRMHQSLHHLVSHAAWSDTALLKKVREQVLPAMTRGGKLTAWIVDETGFPKRGYHSVGVVRQFCGPMGKMETCRIAISVSVATNKASLPLQFRLYLPPEWANDAARRSKARVPEDIRYQTKLEIALELIRSLCNEDVDRGVVLGDADSGNVYKFLEELEGLELLYVLGIRKYTSAWLPDLGLPSSRWPHGEGNSSPLQVEMLAEIYCSDKLRWIRWPEGSRGVMRSRFTRLRVCVAGSDNQQNEPLREQWLLIEWPKGEKKPTRFWVSNLPKSVSLRRLVFWAKQSWISERDNMELIQELGLGHFEGRGWRGFHHHASLAIAAYGFLVKERCLHPSAPGKSLRAADLLLPLPCPDGNCIPSGATDPK